MELLRFHTARTDLTVLTTDDVGHVWPMRPAPLNWPLRVVASGEDWLVGA
jgi:muramoyltetrapeptide carboxypeptidase LdcA involved in peptidoglycan recycling